MIIFQGNYNLRPSRLVLTMLVVGALTQTTLAGKKPTTLALTTTVPGQATKAERDMMANLLALTEVAVSQQPAITVVERMEIDSALHELVLNRDLGSDDHSLQLGKLAAAELIVTAKLLDPTEDDKRYVLVRVTQSLSGKILGGAVAPVDELTVDQAAQEIAGYIAAVGTHPQTAGITIAVAPFDSSGQFDRLRPLERSLRDMVVSRLIEYQQFRVLQRSEMRDLITEIDLARSGLSDAAQLLETLPSRRAAYLLNGTIDERNTGDERQLIVKATVLNANTKAEVDSIRFESPPEEMPKQLGVHLHLLVEEIVDDAGRGNGKLAPAPQFDEVEHLFQRAVVDLYRFWRRKPRDFSYRDFRLPGIKPKSDGYSRVPLDSTIGKAMLRKAVDRLESVLYLQPERRDAELALAFCLICHMDDLWQPERADRLLRNVYHRDPTDPVAAEALNWLAEMYYHHESGDLKPEDAAVSHKQALFAFEKMPAAHRDYEWTRLIELLTDNFGRSLDDHATANVMRLAADFMAKVEPNAQRNLASHVGNIAQSLCAAPHGNPNLQAEARKLLDDWSTSDHKWKRYHALQALAEIAQREKNLAKAIELYRAAGESMKGVQNDHVHHSNLLQAARLLRQAGDADAALALLQSFEPQDRRPSSLLNGRYGEELGTTLEALGRKKEALETYVSYAETSAHLVDNSDVDERIQALGGVPLREDRDIDVRYIDGPDNNPLYCRSLATDGKILYVGGFPRGTRGRGVSALNLVTNKWIPTIGGPEVRAVCLAYEAGYLWIGTEEQGLWRCTVATGTWKNWKLKDGLPDNRVVDVAAQQDVAYVSVGDRNAGGVLSIDAENRLHVYEDKGAPSVALYDLTLHNRRLYGINRRLFELDLSSSVWQVSLPPEASRHFGLYGLFRAESELWGSCYMREIFRIGASPEENARYKQAWFPAELNNIKAGYGAEFALERKGQLWFGGSPWARFKSCGFYRLDLQTGEFVIYGPRDGFRLSTTYECYDGVEAADRMWIATSAGLAEITVREQVSAETDRDSNVAD